MRRYYKTVIVAIYDGCYYMEIMFDDMIYRYSDYVFKQYPIEIQNLMNQISENYRYVKTNYEEITDLLKKYCDYDNLYIIDNGSIEVLEGYKEKQNEDIIWRDRPLHKC